MYLNESSYFYDVILPECCYLERSEPLPHAANNHRMIGGMGNPWTIAVWQKVVEPRDGAPSSWELFSELADRAGKNAEFIGLLNKFFRVKEEYAVPMDQKLEVEAFADSVLKSNIDEEHDFAWFKEHGVYDIRAMSMRRICGRTATLVVCPCISTSCWRPRRRWRPRWPSWASRGDR